MSQTSGAEAILDILETYGVEQIFSSPGSEWPPVWEALAKRRANGKQEPRFVNCRHEVLAVCAAIAYQRATGKLPVVLLHTTVGTLNGSMAIRMAYREQVPMVVFAGGSSTFGEGLIDPGAQWLRFLADPALPSQLVDSYVKWSGNIINTETFAGTVRHACELAVSYPQGPTFVYVPLEIMLQQVKTESLVKRDMRREFVPSSQLLNDAFELMLKSHSPLIVTENAGAIQETVSVLVEFAETFGVPVVETHGTAYMNFPRDHPLHLGFDPKPFLQDADLVILLGVKAPWHPASKWPTDKTRVIQIDQDPVKSNIPYWNYRVDLTLNGSLQMTLNELIRMMKDKVRLDVSHQLTDEIERRINNSKKIHDQNLTKWKSESLKFQNDNPVDLRWAYHEFGRIIPDDAIVVDELIIDRTIFNQLMMRKMPGTFYAGSFGGLGTGLGIALGMKMFHKDRIIISILGDGAFNYNPVLPCLGFVQEHNTPILIVIINNGTYGSQERALLRKFPDGYSAKTGIHYGAKIHPQPNYVDVAKAFGAHAKKVENPEELGPALIESIERVKSGQLALLDVVIKEESPNSKTNAALSEVQRT